MICRLYYNDVLKEYKTVFVQLANNYTPCFKKPFSLVCNFGIQNREKILCQNVKKKFTHLTYKMKLKVIISHYLEHLQLQLENEHVLKHELVFRFIFSTVALLRIHSMM